MEASHDSTAATQNLSPEHSLEIFELDGTDFVKSFTTVAKVVEHCRSGKGPALVHAHVTRPLSHSSADTQAYYRLAEDLEKEAGRDPLVRMVALLAKCGVPVGEAERA